jgi:O-antigen/teichoic acid export membrane protein
VSLTGSVARLGRLFGTASTGLGGQLLTAQVLTAGVALAVNVLAARGMSPDGRGALALLLQLVYVLTTCAVLGRDRSYPAILTSTPALATAARQIRQLLAGPLVLLIVGCLLVFPAMSGTTWGQWTVIGGVGLALALVGNVGLVAARSASIAAQTGGGYLATVVASQAGLLLLTVGLVLAGRGEAYLWLLAYGVALSAAAAFWFARRGAEPAEGDAAGRARARRLGIRLLPASLANIVMLRADRLLLPALGSLEQLGLYIVVAALTEALAWPVQTLVDSRIPAWRLRATRGTLRPGRLLLGAFGYAVAGTAAVAMLISLLLVPVFGEPYSGASALVLPLSAAAACYAVSRVGVGLGVARNAAGRVFAADLAGMVVALTAYLVLIPSLGAMGAALGCLAGYGTTAVVATVLALLPSTRGASGQDGEKKSEAADVPI